MTFNRFVFYFAATGLLLSVIIHGLAIAGSYPGGWVFGMHVAAIAAFAPLVFFLRKKAMDRGLNPNRMGSPVLVFRVLFENTPKWLKGVTIVFFAYAFVNFFLFITAHNQQVQNMRDLQVPDQAIRSLPPDAQMLRGFSGHWMVFFNLVVAGLYPPKKEN